MPKICKAEGCSYNVWGKGYCKMHQRLRTDSKRPKSIRKISAKRQEEKEENGTELDLFLEIWDDRVHFSELSGKPLLHKGHPQWHHQFLHILGKGTHPKLRLMPENILLALPEEHDRQDTFKEFNRRKVDLLRMVYCDPI